MKFTDISIIDSIMSIGIALFILIKSFGNIKEVLDLFLEKTPSGISSEELLEHLSEISGIKDIHHLHLWSIDGSQTIATMHVISDDEDTDKIKKEIREEMVEHGISHVTIEIENSKSQCEDKECNVKTNVEIHHHHHH